MAFALIFTSILTSGIGSVYTATYSATLSNGEVKVKSHYCHIDETFVLHNVTSPDFIDENTKRMAFDHFNSFVDEIVIKPVNNSITMDKNVTMNYSCIRWCTSLDEHSMDDYCANYFTQPLRNELKTYCNSPAGHTFPGCKRIELLLNYMQEESHHRKERLAFIPATAVVTAFEPILYQFLKSMDERIPLPDSSTIDGHPTTFDNETIKPILDYSHSELIKHFNQFMVNTTEYKEHDNITYCSSGIKRQSSNDTMWTGSKLQSTSDVIQLHSEMSTTQRSNPIWNATSNPVREYGQQEISPNVFVPLYIRADIRHAHLHRLLSRPPIPTTIYDHLYNHMGFQNQNQQRNRCIFPVSSDNPDEAGHLLPVVLGGTSNETYNFIPMTRSLNRGAVTTFGMIRSAWYFFEYEIEKFLIANRSGRVDWQVAVIYNQQNSIAKHRPVGISLEFEEFVNVNDAHPSYSFGSYTFSNNPVDESCRFEPLPNY